MGEIALIEISAQRRPITGHGNRLGREGIADEIVDGKVHIQRQIGTHKGEAARNYRLETICFTVKCIKVLGSTICLPVGSSWFGEGRTAGPIFWEGIEIRWLGAEDAAGVSEQEAPGACGDGEIEDVGGNLIDLMVALVEGRR